MIFGVRRKYFYFVGKIIQKVVGGNRFKCVVDALYGEQNEPKAELIAKRLSSGIARATAGSERLFPSFVPSYLGSKNHSKIAPATGLEPATT